MSKCIENISHIWPQIIIVHLLNLLLNKLKMLNKALKVHENISAYRVLAALSTLSTSQRTFTCHTHDTEYSISCMTKKKVH